MRFTSVSRIVFTRIRYTDKAREYSIGGFLRFCVHGSSRPYSTLLFGFQHVLPISPAEAGLPLMGYNNFYLDAAGSQGS